MLGSETLLGVSLFGSQGNNTDLKTYSRKLVAQSGSRKV